MHSLAMAEGILNVAFNEAGKHNGRRIKAIGVKIDEEFIEYDSLGFYLEAITKGTIAEGARIEIELVGAKGPSQVTLELD